MKTILPTILAGIFFFLIIYAVRAIALYFKENSVANQICEHCYNNVKINSADIREDKYICPICKKENNIISI